MKRLFLVLVLGALTLACQHSAQHRELAAGTWDAQVRNQLNGLLETYQDSGAYAVFDFDKTSIVHDVSQALWVYQVEHLRYADAPAHGFLDGMVFCHICNALGIRSAYAGDEPRDEMSEIHLNTLRQICAQSGIVLKVAERKRIGDKYISSSMVRKAIAAGDMETVGNLVPAEVLPYLTGHSA